MSYLEDSNLQLADIATAISMGPFGSNLKVESFTDHGVPVLRGSNLSSFSVDDTDTPFVSVEKAATLSRSLAGPGDLVLTHRGTLGQVSMIPRDSKYEKYLVSQSQMLVKINEKMAVPEFLTYWFRSETGQRQLLAFATQTGVPAIAQPVKSLRSIRVPVPPIQVQRKISCVLGALDDKIAANRRIAKVGLQLIDAAYLGVKKFRSSSFEEVCDLGGGGTPSTKSPEFWGGQIPWATPSDITSLGGNPWLLETGRNITPIGFNNTTSKMYPRGTVLMTSRASVGHCALASVPTSVNQGFIALTPKETGLQSWYFAQLRSRKDEFIAWANGATFLELSRGVFKRLPVDLPGEGAVDKFRNLADPALLRIESAQKENEKLAATRDELLPLLMSGKITVKDAEKRVEGEV